MAGDNEVGKIDLKAVKAFEIDARDMSCRLLMEDAYNHTTNWTSRKNCGGLISELIDSTRHLPKGMETIPLQHGD